MEPRFSGKVAIITGAGKALAKAWRYGWRVKVRPWWWPSTTLIPRQKRARQFKLRADERSRMPSTSPMSPRYRMVNDVVSAFGRIDILVNNAGVVQTKPMLDLSEADWDQGVDVNQRGTFFCLQAVAQQMIRQLPEALRSGSGLADVLSHQLSKEAAEAATASVLAASYGKIVNFSSIAGRRGRPLSTHYAATKATIISITQSAALALAPYRINVNAVCPGIVPTPMWTQIDQDRAHLFGAKEGEAMAAFIQQVPLKRAATPEDLAGVVAFLCSADADYITGQAINVDGGFEMN